MTHLLELPIHSNDPFSSMTYPLERTIHLKASFSRPIHLNDPFTQMTHSLEWSIHSNDLFVNDPFVWMTHSLKWPIHLNDPFTWMTHLQMTHSLKWPICLNDPFTWMTHSLEWPIHMQTWNVCLPLLSKQYYLKVRSFSCNKLWSNDTMHQSCAVVSFVHTIIIYKCTIEHK